VPATITVTGIGGTSATLSVSDLSKLPQQTVKATDDGTPVTFEGV
jgi:uridine phosphorylase